MKNKLLIYISSSLLVLLGGYSFSSIIEGRFISDQLLIFSQLGMLALFVRISRYVLFIFIIGKYSERKKHPLLFLWFIIIFYLSLVPAQTMLYELFYIITGNCTGWCGLTLPFTVPVTIVSIISLVVIFKKSEKFS